VDRQTHTHTHPFNGTLSRTTRVGRYRKGKTNLDFTEARDSELQWHQLGRMQVCTSLQADNHASIPPLSFYRPYALPAMQPTVSKHCRQKQKNTHTDRQTDTVITIICFPYRGGGDVIMFVGRLLSEHVRSG